MTECGCSEICWLTGWSDRFQPATRELMVFTKNPKRYFDLDAVREPATTKPQRFLSPTYYKNDGREPGSDEGDPMTATFYVGDAIETMNKLPEKSVDLVLTSPPFLALRSYLPADHPDKALEGGSQATPGLFIDWLVDVVEACDRVLAPHGSMCIELGDTYAGSGGAGGDYNVGGWRSGQVGAPGSMKTERKHKVDGWGPFRDEWDGKKQGGGSGWPLAKSLSLIPELFRLTLVYGTNPLTGRQTERWRLRNVIRWVRPNPPVGALGDKFRPATSELMVFCKSAKRYFDLDAVREPWKYPDDVNRTTGAYRANPDSTGYDPNGRIRVNSQGGAPPLDWWNIPPGGYSGTVMWTARKPVDPRESVGDIWRTTSSDCPVHADQPDQATTALHDEPVSADRPDRNRGKGANPAPKPLPGSAPIDPLPWPTLEDGSSDSPHPESTDAAIPRGKGSNKTALAPVTSSPGTPSEETQPHTGDKPALPVSGEPSPGTPENRTSSDGLDGSHPGTSDHIVDTSEEPFDEACTCSYWVAEAQSTSHYAVFPPELCIKPIKAMCPERVCRVCGEPSRRIVQDSEAYAALKENGTWKSGIAEGKGAHSLKTVTTTRDQVTLGFSDCGHDDWRPGVVLDPFGGSGTTALVATGHGRDCILIDLDERNYELALQRVGPFILERAS